MIYEKKQYKSPITKSHKIKKNVFFLWCSLKWLRSLLSFFFFLDFVPEIKQSIVGKSSD